MRLRTLLAALGHTIDVVLFNPKEHIRLALGRIQTCRRIDRQLLSTCLFASVADLIDIALDLINLCRVGIRIGIEALSPLDGHVNRGVGRRCRGILAHIELIVRSRSSAKGIDGRVGAHIGGVKDLSRNGVITRGELILGTLIGRARIVGGKAHRIADFLARSLQKTRGHRDLAGTLGQIAAHQHRLIDILPGKALDDHALARCTHGGVGGLGVDALGCLDAVDLLNGRKIVTRKAIGRLHVNVIDILLVKVGVNRIAQVLAARLKATHHAHAKRRDDHDGQEALKTASDCAVDATAKHRRHHVV